MRVEPNASYYYMYNGHADVTALLNASTGSVDATYYYDVFGNVLSKTGNVENSIRYAGYQYDEETGLYYLNARMYDPVTARFLQEDTYRGNPNDPLSLNLYACCNNNPLKYYDPTGHSPFPLSSGDYFSYGRNRGVYNKYVKEIQKRLQKVGCLGYFSDATDGKFGPKTKDAVKSFQRKNKMKDVDGCVGPLTWAMLFPDNSGKSSGNSSNKNSGVANNKKNQSSSNHKRKLSDKQVENLCRENKMFKIAKDCGIDFNLNSDYATVKIFKNIIPLLIIKISVGIGYTYGDIMKVALTKESFGLAYGEWEAGIDSGKAYVSHSQQIGNYSCVDKFAVGVNQLATHEASLIYESPSTHIYGALSILALIDNMILIYSTASLVALVSRVAPAIPSAYALSEFLAGGSGVAVLRRIFGV